jgi:hypothetical protein
MDKLFEQLESKYFPLIAGLVAVLIVSLLAMMIPRMKYMPSSSVAVNSVSAAKFHEEPVRPPTTNITKQTVTLPDITVQTVKIAE